MTDHDPRSTADARAERPERSDARRNRARILAAAEYVFAERGASGSTADIARRAGVASGTVFRHFPTKQALLQAIMKDLLASLRAQAEHLAADGDPGTALFTFVTDLVDQAATRRTVVDLLADTGITVTVDGAVADLGETIAVMLGRAQSHHTVRDDVSVTDVTALLIGVIQAALRAAWSPDTRRHVLQIIFDGLRPAPDDKRVTTDDDTRGSIS